jgi:hypothetical protein
MWIALLIEKLYRPNRRPLDESERRSPKSDRDQIGSINRPKALIFAPSPFAGPVGVGERGLRRRPC